MTQAKLPHRKELCLQSERSRNEMFRLLLKLCYSYTFCCKLASLFFRDSISASFAAFSAVSSICFKSTTDSVSLLLYQNAPRYFLIFILQRKKRKRKSKEKKEEEIIPQRAQEIFREILFSSSVYYNKNTFYDFLKCNT